MELLLYMGEPLLSGYLEAALKLNKTINSSTSVCEKAQAPSGGNNVLLFLLEKISSGWSDVPS